MICGSLNGRGVWGRMDTLHAWLSPFTVHLKLPQHCLLISCTPIQNKKSERKKHPVEDHFIRLLNLYTFERLNLCHHTLISALNDTEILVSKLLSFRTWGLYSIRLQVSTDADEKTAVSHGNTCSFVGNLLFFL